MSGADGDKSNTGGITPEVQKLIVDAQREVRDELLRRFAIGTGVAVIGLFGLAALGAWVILKPILQTALGVPAGAVAAFDLPGGCPKDFGWSPFDSAGRTIMGVSSQYTYNARGGGSYVLSPGNLPKVDIVTTTHAHPTGGGNAAALVVFGGSPAGSGFAQQSTLVATFGLPTPTAIDTIPPYVALYYCRKDG